MEKTTPTYQQLAQKVKDLEKKLAKTQWLNESEKVKDNEPFIPFYGDVTKLNMERTILDTVGKETLENLTSELMDLLDTSVAIYEKNGDYAYGKFNSGWCQSLDAASRKLCNTDDNKVALNCGKWLCHDVCWNKSAKTAIQSKKQTDIECPGAIRLYAEPIFVANEVIGVVNIGYGNPPTDEKTLENLSEKYNVDFNTLKQKAIAYKPRPDFIIEIAKKRLKSIAKLIGEIVSRKQAENSLSINEQRLTDAQHIAKIGNWEMNVKTGKTYMSDQMFQLFGYKPDEVIASDELFRKHIHTDDLHLFDESITAFLSARKEINVIFRYVTKDGEIRNAHSIGQIELDKNGEPVKTWGTLQDVTKIKKAEQQLKVSEEKLDLIFNESPFPIVVADLNDEKITYWSKSAQKLTGYAPKTVSEWYSLAYPDPTYQKQVIEQWKPMYKKALESDNAINTGEYQITCKDGSVMTCELYAQIIPGSLVVTFNDVTERRKVELDIEKNRKEFQTWIQHTPVCTKKIDLDFNLQYMSEAGIRELKVDDINELYGAPYPFNFFPEPFKKAMASKMKEAKETGQIKQIDGILSDTQGNQMWYNHILVPVKNSMGKVEYLLIISSDISERKHTEEKLKFKNEEYEVINEELRQANEELIAAKLVAEENETKFKSIFENLVYEVHLWEVIKNKDGKIKTWKLADVNPSALKAWKKTKEQVIGKTTDEIFEYDTANEFRPIVEEIFKTGKPLRWEKFFKPTNQYLSMDSIPFGNYFISTGRDVSHDKQMELRLKTNNEELIAAIEKAETSEEQHRFLFENMIQGVVYHDLTGKIFYGNKAAAHILGLTMDQLHGKTSMDPEWKTIHEDGSDYPGKTHPVAITLKTKEAVKNVKMGVYIPSENRYNWININSLPRYNKKTGELYQVVVTFEDITEMKNKTDELKKAKEKAEENEIQLNAILEKSPTGFTINKISSGEVTYVNKAFADAYHIPIELCSNVSSFFEYVYGDQMELGKQFLDDVNSGDPGRMNWDKVPITDKATKATHYVSASNIMLKDLDLMISTVLDITSQVENENKLIQSDRVFNLTLDMFCIAGFDGYFKYLNPAWKRTLGWSIDELLSKPWLDFVHPDDAEKTEDIKSVIVDGIEIYKFENRYICKDGSIKWLSWNSQPFPKENIMIGAVRDITQQKKMEQDLIVAKEKAEESDRLKTVFLQNLSHEIRTPLNAICGFSNRINRPSLSEEKRNNFTSIIQSSSQQLLTIVTDILTISSLETNQEKLYINKVCINNIIVEMLSMYKKQSIDQNISLYARQPLTDCQSEIYTDKSKIVQILRNLVSNAIKFTHEGMVEFGYNLKTENEHSELEFYVKDTGIGIKPEVQKEIFNSFQQADVSDTRKHGGTGLGLAISKGFTELLGGKIWVESEINNGSTFYFTIPYKPAGETGDVISSVIPINAINQPIILVAEDEEFNFLYIEELLIDQGYKLIHAKDGKEAVEIATSQELSLILMDIKMPVMDGEMAAKAIKKEKPQLPIIAQSAYALEHEIEKYSQTFDDYLAKPINEESLIEVVNKYVLKEKPVPE